MDAPADVWWVIWGMLPLAIIFGGLIVWVSGRKKRRKP